MLAIEGSEPQLVAAAGGALLAPGQVVLFGHGQSPSTRFERGEIERLGIQRVSVEVVRDDPEAAARRMLRFLAPRADRYAIHLDVDVVDFTDAALSEHPSLTTPRRTTGSSSGSPPGSPPRWAANEVSTSPAQTPSR
jgi:arginase